MGRKRGSLSLVKLLKEKLRKIASNKSKARKK